MTKDKAIEIAVRYAEANGIVVGNLVNALMTNPAVQTEVFEMFGVSQGPDNARANWIVTFDCSMESKHDEVDIFVDDETGVARLNMKL